MISRCAWESCARALATSCRSSARTAASPPGGVGAPTVASSTGATNVSPRRRTARTRSMARVRARVMIQASGDPRAHYRGIVGVLESFTQGEVSRRERLQKLALMDQGITFTVYGEKEGLERIFPFDFVPRVVTAREWERLEAGLVQRVTALNLFIADVYGEQKCLKDNVLPPALLLSRKEYKRELLNVRPPRGVYTHVVGTDLTRDDRGEFLVLEDNCRCPSGVSYVLENRNLMTRVFPELFGPYPVRPIKDYPNLLLDALLHAAPRTAESPAAVVLSPGIHNSAFFEHSFLAREMGTTLVEGRDLLVEDNYVFMRTTRGRQRVDVVYRRIDEDFLDPLVFRRDSLLGVPGLLNAYRAGNVAIANAPGASSHGASTCDPSSSTATACACCPAGSRGWRCAKAPTS